MGRLRLYFLTTHNYLFIIIICIYMYIGLQVFLKKVVISS